MSVKMTEEPYERHSSIKTFIDFWTNKTDISKAHDTRELLTKCLDEVTASYMMSDVDPGLKEIMREMSKAVLTHIQSVPPGCKLCISDDTLDMAFRVRVDEKAEENNVQPDFARLLSSFSNAVLYPYLSYIMHHTVFMSGYTVDDEDFEWRYRFMNCIDKVLECYMEFHDSDDANVFMSVKCIYEAVLELFECVGFPIQLKRRTPDTA